MKISLAIICQLIYLFINRQLTGVESKTDTAATWGTHTTPFSAFFYAIFDLNLKNEIAHKLKKKMWQTIERDIKIF